MLGGAATHFALAASFFDEVRVVGPVGDDFDEDAWHVLRTRGTITDDVEHVAGGKTFFWKGEYHDNLNSRETLDTDLNVFEDFEPKLSQAARDCDVLFLANIQPDLQREVREQCAAARFVAMDSMDLWINIAHASLVETIRGVDCVILNDEELEMLTERPTVLSAAREVLSWGPTAVVAKQGKYGAALFTARRLLRHARLPAGGGRRPDRRGRQLRRRLRRLRRRDGRRGGRPRAAVAGDGLRDRDRLVQRRGVRHGAGRAADRTPRSTSA